MNAARRKTWKTIIGSALRRFASPLGGPARPVLIVLALLLLFFAAAIYVRHQWPDLLAGHNRQRLTAEQIEVVPPQPDWIKSDVKAEVVGGGLANLNPLDRDLTTRVAGAFAVHNWVAEVIKVHKQAGPKIVVELCYRRPVAMVEVASGSQSGLLAVDKLGVLLPPDDFVKPTKDLQTQLNRQYLRITAKDAQPAGPIGTAWGDDRVVGAARIAAAWQGRWKVLGLFRIVALGDRPQHAVPATIQYELYTRGGLRILWGRAPGEELSGEATAEQKVDRLEQYVADKGPLDQQTPAGDIDLRDGQALQVTPRTARRPGL